MEVYDELCSGATWGKVVSTPSVDYGKAGEDDSQTDQAAVQPSRPASPNRCSKILYDPRWVAMETQKAEEGVRVHVRHFLWDWLMANRSVVPPGDIYGFLDFHRRCEHVMSQNHLYDWDCKVVLVYWRFVGQY